MFGRKLFGTVFTFILLAYVNTPLLAEAAEKKSLYVYTSIYKEFITPIQKEFEKQNPTIDLQIFQSGSEKIQAKVEAELLSGKPQADVLLTSDPFWAYDLQKRGLGGNKETPAKLDVNYYSLMVLIVNKSFAESERPKSFLDLKDVKYKNLVQMGSPLESGTMFSAVAYLSHKFGWKYFSDLRANGIASNGGNSSVIEKVESGEKKIGMVLLENALASKKRGSPIDIVYPSDGAIPVPSVEVILQASKVKDEAHKFSDFLRSKTGQELLRDGYMYSIRKDVTAPEGAKHLDVVTKNSDQWTPSRIEEVAKDSKKIKKLFSQTVLD
jgi:iron(III) transport system substrate-binding protein